MRLINRVRNYFVTHFAASFSAIMAVVFLVVIFSQQEYLKQEYQNYLLEQSYETENAVLSAIQQNMQASIRELVAMGAKMAADDDVYELAVSADQVTGANDESNNMIMQLYRELQGYGYMNSVVTAAVVREEGLLTQYDKSRTNDTVMWNEDTIDAIEKMADCFWGEQRTDIFPRYQVFTEPGVHPGYSNCRIFHIAYPLTGGKVSVWDTEYLLVLTYNLNLLEEFVDTINVPKVEYIRGYVADENGVIVYHSDETLIGTTEDQLMEASSNAHVVKDIGYFEWKIGAVIDEGKVMEHISEIYRRGSRVYILLFAAGVVIIFMWFRRLMKPVHRMSESMKRVEQGNFHSKIDIEGEHEIWQIAEEYNRMIEAIEQKNREIEYQHKETLRSIEQQHQAEREALESQINAHFICNTLGCINYEAIDAGNYKVSILIKKLSNILRYSFDQKSQEVYIFQEIAWIDQYLYLQQSRMENMFEYEVDFPEVYGQWPCCKLMFQPFVENSILHGFEGLKDGGFIRILGEMEGERLKITIEDNGCGMNADTERVLQEIIRKKDGLFLDRKKAKGESAKRQGIGIKNVVTRMRMYYGSRFEISLETEYGKGTKFVFLIPIPENYDIEDEDI